MKALGTEIGQRQYSEHALSSMPAMMEGKTDDPFWSTFIKEVDYLDSLDDLKSPYYLQCIGDPAFTSVIFGADGADMDIADYMNNTVVPELDQCLQTASVGE